MDIKEMIRKYDISLSYDGRTLICRNMTAIKEDKAEENIKSRKPEIVAYLNDEKEREDAERQEKINSIEGLKEIQSAIEEQERWEIEFNRRMESEDGFTGMRERPKDRLEELTEKYPRAAAYLIAEQESLKSNYELSAIGRKALERIIDGEDYELVLSDMKKERSEYVNRHIWD